MSAPIALNSQNYAGLDTGIQDILKQGKRALITIYTDAAGTALASDEHGNIEDREVLSISFTASYKDAVETYQPFRGSEIYQRSRSVH